MLKDSAIELEAEKDEHVCRQVTIDMRERELKQARKDCDQDLAEKEAECKEELAKKEKKCIKLKERLKASEKS